ncbi:hypothetical protein U9M48_040686, partial [Paspalum notatum var. saurae]
MLSVLIIKRAKDNVQIRGAIPHLVEDGLFILQCADDTILFMDHDLDQAKNLKLLLYVFEQLSSLKLTSIKVSRCTIDSTRIADWSVVEEKSILGRINICLMGAMCHKQDFGRTLSIIDYPHPSVQNVMNHQLINISVRNKLTSWNNLVSEISNIQLSSEVTILPRTHINM